MSRLKELTDEELALLNNDTYTNSNRFQWYRSKG